ncbi:hypothetical protein ATI02_4331 [Pseudomonas baetica]|uniref:Uncharacterized protein n=1 Tax=Pseudomonas baetica TaxID=674054 RepID=A0ABX4Q3L4_9PSED|nr:hypothetical protein [Pseudomonas baetica]PKA71353.1 hypothetical protein ATI02_4331 [Pseudomonas baetica]
MKIQNKAEVEAVIYDKFLDTFDKDLKKNGSKITPTEREAVLKEGAKSFGKHQHERKTQSDS